MIEILLIILVIGLSIGALIGGYLRKKSYNDYLKRKRS